MLVVAPSIQKSYKDDSFFFSAANQSIDHWTKTYNVRWRQIEKKTPKNFAWNNKWEVNISLHRRLFLLASVLHSWKEDRERGRICAAHCVRGKWNPPPGRDCACQLPAPSRSCPPYTALQDLTNTKIWYIFVHNARMKLKMKKNTLR